MKFWKMNGAGNDFIIINNIEENIPEDALPAFVKHVCNQHLSVGADGLMAVERAEHEGDLKMRFYNSDGSVGEMCGNGARCICRYAFENGMAGDVQKIETMAGLVIGERIDKRRYRVRLNDPASFDLEASALIDGKEVKYSYVELGNPGIPHIAVEIKGLKCIPEEELFELGKKLRYYEKFPKGTNVNFYELTGENALFERTWERGVEGFTLACGTGTGSVVAILTLLGKVSGQNTSVIMEGGELNVDVRIENGKIKDLFLSGPTNSVAIGELTDEELPMQLK